MKLLGVPLFIWGGACLALATLWTIFWPRDRVSTTSGLRFVIVRWFHALTWLLLAIAAFVAYFNLLGPDNARQIAFAALMVYLIFVATLVTNREPRTKTPKGYPEPRTENREQLNKHWPE